MAGRSLLTTTVSDLCIGKPPLLSLPASASILDAIPALKASPSASLPVCSCSTSASQELLHAATDSCVFATKLSMLDVVSFLSRADNVRDPETALASPISAVVSAAGRSLLRRVDPHSRLLEALDLLVESGVHNLVVPIQGGSRRKCCWLTQDDVARYLLNSITDFAPLPAISAAALGIVRGDFLAVDRTSPAVSVAGIFTIAHKTRTAVAVLDGGGVVGEIAPGAIRDESLAAAMAVLSAGELAGYIVDGSHCLRRTVRDRLERQLPLSRMLQLYDDKITSTTTANSPSSSSSPMHSSSSSSSLSSSFSSSEDDSEGLESCRPMVLCCKGRKRDQLIACRRGSSLVGVMAQALAHRVGHVWVVGDDEEIDDGGPGIAVAGIVTLTDVLGVFRRHLRLLAAAPLV